MKVTVVSWRAFSPHLNKRVPIELGYPMRDFQQSCRMFFEEYPEAEEDIEHVSVYEFNSQARPDLYEAFSSSGCIRTWRTY